MKTTAWMVALCGVALVGTAMAGDDRTYEIEEAPADYLAMENPIPREELNDTELARIAQVYNTKCGEKCHGVNGDSKGKDTPKMPLKPVAFTKPGYLAGKKDGQLFWIIQKGSKDSEMKPFGEDSEHNLSEDEIWELVSYLRIKFTPPK